MRFINFIVFFIFTVQSKGMPSFTSVGYKKMKIPKLLYETVLNSKNTTQIEPEICATDEIPVQNCFKIKQDGTIGKGIFKTTL